MDKIAQEKTGLLFALSRSPECWPDLLPTFLKLARPPEPLNPVDYGSIPRIDAEIRYVGGNSACCPFISESSRIERLSLQHLRLPTVFLRSQR